jgi:hypothetical protein
MSRRQSQVNDITGSIASLRTILEDYPTLGTMQFTPQTAIELLLEIVRLFGISYTEVLNWISRLLSGELISQKIINAASKGLDKLGKSNDNGDTKDTSDTNDTGDVSKTGLLDIIEIAIKSVLLANFQGMYTCTVNPFLPDNLMLSSQGNIPYRDLSYDANNGDNRGGMRLNVDGIDLFGVLRNIPTSKTGKNFYFDTTTRLVNRGWDSLLPSELYKSFDFNAFLWYVINKSEGVSDMTERKKCTWDNRVPNLQKFRRANDEKLLNAFLEAPSEVTAPNAKDNVKRLYQSNKINGLTKKGIVICDYDKSHVDVINGDSITIWANADRYYKTRKIWGQKCHLYDSKDALDEEVKKRKSHKYKHGDAYWVDDCIKMYTSSTELKTFCGNDFYVNKTIYEFNFDFIYSLKLFDSKVLVMSILNSLLSLTRGVSLNASLTIEQRAMAVKIEQMISKTIELDDQEIDNSSYDFDNTAYDAMLEQGNNAALSDEEQEALNNYINGIDNAATYDEQTTAISSAISAFTYNVITTEDEGGTSSKFGLYGSTNLRDMFNLLIKEIVVDLVMQVLTPKVMVLYAVNSYVMGGDMEDVFKINDWDKVLDSWKNLIINMTCQIKDIIIKELYNWVVSKISPLIKLFVEKLTLEALNYYTDLITQLIENCTDMASSFNSSNTVIDNVNYADIIPTQTQPE